MGTLLGTIDLTAGKFGMGSMKNEGKRSGWRVFQRR